jgi:hypothetical protein
MRITILLLTFILLTQASQAASLLTKPSAGTVSVVKPPKLRFKERKGTMGFVYAFILGPIGYFGVRIFSPNSEEMRYQAARGFKAWGFIVLSGLIILACAALGGNGDPSNILTALWAIY